MRARAVPIALEKSSKNALTVLDFCKKSLKFRNSVRNFLAVTLLLLLLSPYYLPYYLLADVYTYS